MNRRWVHRCASEFAGGPTAPRTPVCRWIHGRVQGVPAACLLHGRGAVGNLVVLPVGVVLGVGNDEELQGFGA